MQSDFTKRAKQGRRLSEMEFYRLSINEWSGILEQLLREQCLQCFEDLDDSDKMRVSKTVEKIGKGRPIEDFGLGMLIGLLAQTGLFEIAGRRNLDPELFSPQILNQVNKLRVRCTHHSYEATKEEASQVEATVLNLLYELGMAEKPLKIAPLEIPKNEEEKMLWLLKYVLTVIAERPEYDHWDAISEDFGKDYHVFTKVKLVGADRKEDEIVVSVALRESEIHPDVIDTVCENICDEIYEKILKAIPNIKETRLRVCISDEEEGYEFEEEYPTKFYCDYCKKEVEVILSKVCPHCGHLLWGRSRL